MTILNKMLLTSACSTLLISNCLAESDNIIATVNGVKIHESEIAKNFKEIPGYDLLPNEQKVIIKNKIVQAVTQLEAIVQEAKSLKINQTDIYKSQLADFEKQLMYTTLLETHLENFITDSKLKEYYEENKKNYVENKVKASHILVKTQEDAKQIVQKLDAGADFNSLAKEFSIGPSSRDGGNLGWFNKEDMVPEFSDAAFALQTGKYTKEPVQTQFGWHIIILEDRVDETPSLFEDIKEKIKQEVMRKEVEKYTESILKKSDIIINE